MNKELDQAFEEVNQILDTNGNNPEDPAYREAFERWQQLAFRD
jgi:hypothetical protein